MRSNDSSCRRPAELRSPSRVRCSAPLMMVGEPPSNEQVCRASFGFSQGSFGPIRGAARFRIDRSRPSRCNRDYGP